MSAKSIWRSYERTFRKKKSYLAQYWIWCKSLRLITKILRNRTLKLFKVWSKVILNLCRTNTTICRSSEYRPRVLSHWKDLKYVMIKNNWYCNLKEMIFTSRTSIQLESRSDMRLESVSRLWLSRVFRIVPTSMYRLILRLLDDAIKIDDLNNHCNAK